MEVNNSVKGYCSIFGGVSFEEGVLNSLSSHFQANQKVKVEVLAQKDKQHF